MSTVILTNVPPGELQELLDQFVTHDYSGEEYDEYYCINIKPFQCVGCGRAICYASAGPHLIIIWDKNDDETILETAKLLMEGGYDPRIVKYNRIIGPCVEFKDAVENGWVGSISH